MDCYTVSFQGNINVPAHSAEDAMEWFLRLMGPMVTELQVEAVRPLAQLQPVVCAPDPMREYFRNV